MRTAGFSLAIATALLAELRGSRASHEPQWGLRPALQQRRRMLPGLLPLPSHLQPPPRPHRTRRAAMCPTCQVRTSLARASTGVKLLLLSPSASPERVRLSAAELVERLLAPRIPLSTRGSQDGKQIRLIPLDSLRVRKITTSRSPKRVPVGCRPLDRRPSEKEPSERMPGKPLPRTRFDAAAALRRRTRRSGRATPNPMGVRLMTPSNVDLASPPPNHLHRN
jgi:hypothetical protein